MTRAVLVLNGKTERTRALNWIAQVPPGTRLEFRAPKRSLPQNDKMWATLTDIARQMPWHGKRRTAEAWKDIFTAALRSSQNDLEVVPGIEGGFVLLGMHTSDLSKAEMADLITLMQAFAARHGLKLSDDEAA